MTTTAWSRFWLMRVLVMSDLATEPALVSCLMWLGGCRVFQISGYSVCTCSPKMGKAHFTQQTLGLTTPSSFRFSPGGMLIEFQLSDGLTNSQALDFWRITNSPLQNSRSSYSWVSQAIDDIWNSDHSCTIEEFIVI